MSAGIQGAAARAAIIAAVLLSIAILYHAEAAGGTAQKVIVVPYDYPSLEDAVAEAQPGTVIYLTPGSYTVGRVVIDKPLTILGSSADATRLVVRGIITVRGARVVFARLTLTAEKNAFTRPMIHVVDGASAELVDVKITGDPLLIYAEGASLVALTGSRVKVKEDLLDSLVYVKSAKNVVIYNNTVIVPFGLLSVERAFSVAVIGNSIATTATADCGPLKIGGAANTIVAGNAIIGGKYAVCIYSSHKVIIENNTVIPRLNDGLFLVNDGKVSIAGNLVFGHTYAIHAENSGITVLGNIFYGVRGALYGSNVNISGALNNFFTRWKRFGECYGVRGVLDPSYTLRGFYEYTAGELVDEYSGPGQDVPGPDGVADRPLRLCDELVSKYPSLRPVNATAAGGLPAPAELPVMPPIVSRSVGGVTARWVIAPLSPRGNVSVTLSIDSIYFDGCIAVLLQNVTPFMDLAGVNCTGYYFRGGRGLWLVAAELDTHVDPAMRDPRGPHVALQYLSPLHDEGHSLSEPQVLDPGDITGKHRLRLAWFANGTVAVWLDDRLVARGRPPAAPRGRLWLGIVEEVRDGSVAVSVSSLSAAAPWAAPASAGYTPPRLPVIHAQPRQVTVTIPAYSVAVSFNTTTVSRTATVTRVATVTETVTSYVTRTVTRIQTATKTVVVPSERTVTVVKTLYLTTTLNETVPRIDEASARLALLTLMAALVLAALLAKRA